MQPKLSLPLKKALFLPKLYDPYHSDDEYTIWSSDKGDLLLFSPSDSNNGNLLLLSSSHHSDDEGGLYADLPPSSDSVPLSDGVSRVRVRVIRN
jgi:hypothetical protein